MVDQATKIAFRNVFSGRVGVSVLNYILTDLGFYSEIDLDDVEALAKRNYAHRLLSYLGFDESHTQAITESLLKIPVDFNKTEKEQTLNDMIGEQNANE